MKPFRICPDCGATLDPSETCDCQKVTEVERLMDDLTQKSEKLQQLIRDGIRKDAEIRQLEARLQEMEKRALDAETVLEHIPEYWRIRAATNRTLSKQPNAE